MLLHMFREVNNIHTYRKRMSVFTLAKRNLQPTYARNDVECIHVERETLTAYIEMYREEVTTSTQTERR